MREFQPNRRRFLQLTAAGLASSTVLGSQPALAANKQTIMATWGGLDVIVDNMTESGKANIIINVFQSVDFAVRHAASFSASTDIS